MTETLDKRTTGILLTRLAQSGDAAAGALYSRLMDGWLHRDARSEMSIELSDDERELLRRVCPSELQLLGMTP